ncbi:hypothetical protein ON010_g14643 [Phytophthora cinnamomi]|nr:hypothetical protein ON010_g14643 [Phytophthora cinnamomi]
MEVAVGAALHYFQNLSTELNKHLGVRCDLEVMQDLGNARAYTQMRYRNGPNFSSSSNTTLAARIAPDSAVVVADFVDEDACYPIDRTSEGRVGLDSCLSYVLIVAVLLKLQLASARRLDADLSRCSIIFFMQVAHDPGARPDDWPGARPRAEAQCEQVQPAANVSQAARRDTVLAAVVQRRPVHGSHLSPIGAKRAGKSSSELLKGS